MATSTYEARLAQAKRNVSNKAKRGVGVSLHTTTGKPIAGLAAQKQVGKPTRHLCQVIAKIGKHPGDKQMVKRYHCYNVGDTLLHAKLTEGLITLDITYYAKLGYMVLRQATDAEYNAVVAAWQAKRKLPTTEKAIAEAIAKAKAKGDASEAAPKATRKRGGKGKAAPKATPQADKPAPKADAGKPAIAPPTQGAQAGAQAQADKPVGNTTGDTPQADSAPPVARTG